MFKLRRWLIIFLVIITAFLASFLWFRGPKSKDWVIYLSKIKEVEEFYRQTRTVPTEIENKHPNIHYVPESIFKNNRINFDRAYIWFKIFPGMQIGYIMPDNVYVLADGEYDRVSEEYALKILRIINDNAPPEFKKHFYAHYRK